MAASLNPATSSLIDSERRKFEYIGSPSRKYRLSASLSAADDDDVTCTLPAIAVLLRASFDVRLATAAVPVEPVALSC